MQQQRVWVTMSHPEVESVATATREAFDEVWEPNGWKIDDENVDPTLVDTGPINDEPDHEEENL